MKQLTQKFKNGQIKIIEVAHPNLSRGSILVKNYFSLISSGTEGGTIKTARKGYLGKAKERPGEAKKIVETLVSQGVAQTYRAVMKKLDNYSTLGYSCVGKVIDVAEDIFEIKIGDLLCSSEIPGYVMKQPIEYVISSFENGNPIYEERQTICSYTVGKCMEDVEFDEDGKAESIYGYLSCG